MKLIVLLSLILLNCMITYSMTNERREREWEREREREKEMEKEMEMESEENSGINLKAIFGGKNYRGFKKSSTEYYQNEFFKKCDKKTGKYHNKTHEVSYKCKDSSGKAKEVKAKLDMCLGNTSGKLRVGYDFYKTTKDCKVKKNWLKCKAQDPNGKWHKTKYNLNFVIYFMKDKLTCNRNKPWIKKP